MSGNEARVTVRLREEGRSRGVGDRAPGSRGPGDDLGQAIVDAIAHLGDLIAEFQDRIAEEAYLGSGRPRRDRVDRPRGAGLDAPVVITMRDAASAERLANELETLDDVETARAEPGSTPS